MKTGALRTMVQKVVNETGEIRWNTPYAIYQEEKQFQNYTTLALVSLHEICSTGCYGQIDGVGDDWVMTDANM